MGIMVDGLMELDVWNAGGTCNMAISNSHCQASERAGSRTLCSGDVEEVLYTYRGTYLPVEPPGCQLAAVSGTKRLVV